ncbi:prenyltransferase [Candidatus Saccharibacteria bacterium]|nr:prenyltransferase [Candidatus Saccharibacteria bacterium]
MKKLQKNNQNLSLGEVLATSRPFSWINTAVPFFVGYVLAFGRIDLNCVIGTVYFSFFYNLLMYGVNDIFDYESDLKNPRKNSIEGGLVDKQKHRLLFILIVAFNIPILAYLLISGNTTSNILLVMIVFFAFSYSAKPLRFKEIPILDSINSSLHFVLPLVFGLLYGNATELPWPAIIAFFTWGAASQALGAIQDIKPDRMAGIASIATKLGSRFTNTYSLVLYIMTCLIIAVAYFPWGLAAALILSVFPLNVYFFRKYKSEAKSAEYRRAWKNFIWLNLICGFWLAQLLLFAFDPFAIGQGRVALFGGFIILFGIIQLGLILYNYRIFSRPKTKRLGDLPNIDVLIHSTGDKDNIASTLLALIGQNYPHFDIYYANLDHNPQSQRIADSYQDSKLHIIDVDRPPSGWTQQAWASQTLLSKAHADIVVLISADTIILPNTLSVIASQFESGQLDLISLLPADQNKSFWQQLIMSQEQYMLLGLYPAATITGRYPKLATAYSSLLAFNRKTLNKAGGFELVRNSPLEDLDIANKANQAGLKTGFYTASDLAVSQNRSSLKELRQYNQQRLYPSLHFNMPLSISLISGGLVVLSFPIILLSTLLILGQYEGTLILAAGCSLMLLNRIIINIKSKQSIIGSLLYPIGSLIFLLEIITSMLSYELLKPRWVNRREI